MNQAVPDSLVSGFEDLIPSLDLPDLDDRHVLAAAIRAGAQVIVTDNLSDFPAEKIGKYSIQAKSADRFILDLISLDEEKVFRALEKQQKNLKNPPLSIRELLETLEKCGLKSSVSMLKILAEE